MDSTEEFPPGSMMVMHLCNFSLWEQTAIAYDFYFAFDFSCSKNFFKIFYVLVVN